MKSFRFGILLAAFCMTFSVIALTPQTASATVTITPTIVVIEGRERFADVTLLNTQDSAKTYTMRWRFLKQTEGTGAYIKTDKSVTDFDLTQHLVFSPRRITLAGHGLQKIRLGLRLNGATPPAGDYRGHFEIMESNQPAPEGEDESAKSKVAINVNVGFTIPVIYRVGEVVNDATIGQVTTSLNEKTGKIEASVPIIRGKSPYGALGHILVYYKPAGGSEIKVGEVKNANVFTEISMRTFKVALAAENLSGGQLRIVFKDQDPRKDLVIAEKAIPIGR